MDKVYPTDANIERAAELWCRALKHPTWDTGENNTATAMGVLLIIKTAPPADMRDEMIEKFRVVLVEKLKFLRDNHGKQVARNEPNNFTSNWDNRYRKICDLETDYAPDEILSYALREAGINPAQAPVKSKTKFWGDCVIASFGYSSKPERHWQLPDGRWAIIDLEGSGMPILLQAVQDGLFDGHFKIEEQNNGN